MSNRPFGTLTPDAYPCSLGGTMPSAAAVQPPSDRYDGAMLIPESMVFAVPDKHTVGSQWNTVILFDNLDPGAPTYVDFPFTTAALPGSDVVLNQAAFEMPRTSSYGTQFQVQMALVDRGNDGVEYPLGTRNDVNTLKQTGVYAFVSNQTWPLLGAQEGRLSACGRVGKLAEQGLAGTVRSPVPLRPGHAYALRAYLTLQAGATDRRAILDDAMMAMQAVTVEAQDDGQLADGTPDPAFSFTALNGGTTPSVLGNDRLATMTAPTVPTENRALTQVSADPGLTLDPATGTIAVAPGQAGTQTLTYRLCPDYGNSVVPNFQSSACKTAVATVTLSGPGVVIPPVPTLQQGALALMGLLTAGVAALGLRRRRQGR